MNDEPKPPLLPPSVTSLLRGSFYSTAMFGLSLAMFVLQTVVREELRTVKWTRLEKKKKNLCLNIGQHSLRNYQGQKLGLKTSGESLRLCFRFFAKIKALWKRFEALVRAWTTFQLTRSDQTFIFRRCFVERNTPHGFQKRNRLPERCARCGGRKVNQLRENWCGIAVSVDNLSCEQVWYAWLLLRVLAHILETFGSIQYQLCSIVPFCGHDFIW